MKRIGIIGAGRFGTSLVESLAEYGVEILLIDEKREIVQDFSEFVTKAIEGDVTNIRTLMEAGFQECDVVVIAIGSNLQSSVLATANCKDLGIPKIIARAASDLHGKILKRVGADTIVYPNRDCAKRLSHILLSKGGIDLFEVSEGFTVAEIDVPEPLKNKTLAEVSVRNTYDVTVLCVRRLAEDPEKPRTVIIPTPNEVIQPDDKLLIFGSRKKIDAIVTEA